jgi:3D (Asp-Asp-Asp) domain-containing protein
MEISIEKEEPYLGLKRIVILAIIAGLVTGFLGFGLAKIILAENLNFQDLSPKLDLITVQGNSLLAVSSPEGPQKPLKKIKVVVTAYSSTSWQTDDTPYVTASGKLVEEGIVANNLLAFGTEIRIPELYGDKVFVVEDRMNQKKGYYHVDIWFPNYSQAKDFGSAITYIEILES